MALLRDIAFARNFVLHEDKLGLIGFEDDPLDVISIQAVGRLLHAWMRQSSIPG